MSLTDQQLSSQLRETKKQLAAARNAYEMQRQDCINLTEKVIPNIRADLVAAQVLLRRAACWMKPERPQDLCDSIDLALAAAPGSKT